MFYLCVAEVSLDYNSSVPEGWEIIELPEHTMLWFQTARYEDENWYGGALSEMYRAIQYYKPDTQKQMDIDKNDERNISIANCAKAKAYDLMTFVFGALMVTFALMGVDLIAVLLLVFAYLFVQGYAIYYRCKYDKDM